MDIPCLTLVLDEICQGLCVCNAPLTQVGISTDPAVDIVDGLAMPGDPNLSGRKVEVQKVIHRLC